MNPFLRSATAQEKVRSQIPFIRGHWHMISTRTACTGHWAHRGLLPATSLRLLELLWQNAIDYVAYKQWETVFLFSSLAVQNQNRSSLVSCEPIFQELLSLLCNLWGKGWIMAVVLVCRRAQFHKRSAHVTQFSEDIPTCLLPSPLGYQLMNLGVWGMDGHTNFQSTLPLPSWTFWACY